MEKIVLSEFTPLDSAGHSSKGNQLKWNYGDCWYKADHMGYEGLAEVVIARLLEYSDVADYVYYAPVQIEYKGKAYMGCKSDNFLQPDEELITIEHLFRQYTGKSLSGEMGRITEVSDRIIYMVENVMDFTGLADFGSYISTLLAIDAFFLNEDRHTNNIAVIYRPEEQRYRLSPIFDNGLSLFADVATDFAFDKSPDECRKRIEAKPFSRDFDEQLDAAEEMYGSHVHFTFGKKEIDRILEKCADGYPKEAVERIRETLYQQVRKYKYMFA